MKSPSVQDRFRPMPGVISCAGVTRSGLITYHAYITLLSGLKMSPETQQPPGSVLLSQGSPSPCNLQNLCAVYVALLCNVILIGKMFRLGLKRGTNSVICCCSVSCIESKVYSTLCVSTATRLWMLWMTGALVQG